MRFELYSERIRSKDNEIDCYQYDSMSEKLENQIWLLIDTLNNKQSLLIDSIFESVIQILLLEYGWSSIHGMELNDDYATLRHYFIFTANNEQRLDFIDVFAQMLGKFSNPEIGENKHIISFISDLNFRFAKDGYGYSIENFKIVRKDSEYTHTEMVKPAIAVLTGKAEYKNAQTEFLDAHEAFRKRDLEVAITKANCAFESVMKIIANKRQWTDPQTIQKAPASVLIKMCIDNHLIPASMQSQFSNFCSLLTSSLPAIRNAFGTHGKGESDQEPTLAVTSLALHLSASYILFLINLDES